MAFSVADAGRPPRARGLAAKLLFSSALCALAGFPFSFGCGGERIAPDPPDPLVGNQAPVAEGELPPAFMGARGADVAVSRTSGILMATR